MNPESNKFIEKAATWLVGTRKPGLFLNGGIGNGKTTLMRAICDVLVEKSWEWEYISKIKDSNKGRGDVDMILGFITASDLTLLATSDLDGYVKTRNRSVLFIDDIGGTEDFIAKRFGTSISPVVDTLFWRYDKRLFTVCTTNLSRSEFEQNYGDRVADRAKEMFDWLTFNTVSFRK